MENLENMTSEEFFKKTKDYLEENLPNSLKISKALKGFRYASFFITDGEYTVYVNTGDCRFGDFPQHVLIRCAKDENDYIGGTNMFCAFEEVPKKAEEIIKREIIKRRNKK